MAKGMKIKVEFEIVLPGIYKHEDVKEWLAFNLGALGGMNANNPLESEEIEADYSSLYWREI